jgi:hypothetical protein
MSDLIRQPIPEAILPDLAAAGMLGRYQPFHHGRQIVVWSIDEHSLEEAWTDNLGIRRWLHVSVSIMGALDARLADQKRIGRQRRGGERSPAPLPGWYDLTHIAYGHATELGIDPTRGVWQYLPAPGESYLNLAEALHLRQPL